MRQTRLAGCLSIAALFVAGGAAHAAGCTIGKIAEIPVTMSDMLPTVRGRIGTNDVAFVVDNSILFSRLSPGSVATLGLKAESTALMLSRGNRSAPLNVATVTNFKLGSVTVPKMMFVVVDSQRYAAGSIGKDLLIAQDVEYDLPGGVIRLLKSSGCEKRSLAYWDAAGSSSMLDIDVPGDLQQPSSFEVHVNGQKLHGQFSTKSAVSYISRAAAVRVGGSIVSGRSRNRSVDVARLASVKIGEEDIRNTEVSVVDDLATDIVIGADFFLSHRIYFTSQERHAFFTYSGGPVFKLASDRREVASAGADPVDADGYARRAALSLARGNVGAAIADYGKAIAAAPQEPRYLVERAKLLSKQGERSRAVDDLTHALAIRPRYVTALWIRGELQTDEIKATADADLADASSPPSADERLMIGDIYSDVRAYDKAIGQYDLWIRNHPLDRDMGRALNSRCWARALAGKELDKALKDCNAALRLSPESADFLDSRGLVELRSGHFAKAVADYDAALAIEPERAWSLYCRGVAKRRLGMDKAGDDDMASAVKIDPKAKAEFERLGVPS